MKTKKTIDKKSNESQADDSRHAIKQRKLRQEKIKYRHKNAWLEDEDDDYTLPKYRDEEE